MLENVFVDPRGYGIGYDGSYMCLYFDANNNVHSTPFQTLTFWEIVLSTLNKLS